MAVTTTTFTHRTGGTVAPPSYYLCDTAAELPAGVEGDIAYAKDTDSFYVKAGVWGSLGAGAPVVPPSLARTFMLMGA